MGLLKIHQTVIKHLDKYRKHLLWRGSNLSDKKPSKAAWHMVCLPKNEGGLGVIDLSVQNDALLTKNLDKFFNKTNIPWVQLIWNNYYDSGKLPGYIKRGSFWWRDIIQLLTQYIFGEDVSQNGSFLSCIPSQSARTLLSRRQQQLKIWMSFFIFQSPKRPLCNWNYY
jgi:hypothetical protein